MGRELRVGKHICDQAVSLCDSRKINRRFSAAPTPLVMLMLLLLTLLVLLLVMMVMVTGLEKTKKAADEINEFLEQSNSIVKKINIYITED